MAETVIDQIVAELRSKAPELYPARTEFRAIRVVGHTPKPDHTIYDAVADFADGGERIAAKVYRTARFGQQGARNQAQSEFENMERVYSEFCRNDLPGVPRPLGNFSALGAVVSEKIQGIPLQSIIMKAALLPGYEDHALIQQAATNAGIWLKNFHRLTSCGTQPFDCSELIGELETLCVSCRGEGLDDESIQMVLTGAKNSLAKARKTLPSSAVLNDFQPLNIIIMDSGVGVCDYGHMSQQGLSFVDVASFMAAVEALEKYPFCNREITAKVQDSFIDAYEVSPAERAVIRVLKMKCLLSIFAQGRGLKESAVRKKVMWANVMKRFIHQAASRSLASVA